ncbi:hypothetical protein [Streptomyces mirabilis]
MGGRTLGALQQVDDALVDIADPVHHTHPHVHAAPAARAADVYSIQ